MTTIPLPPMEDRLIFFSGALFSGILYYINGVEFASVSWNLFVLFLGGGATVLGKIVFQEIAKLITLKEVVKFIKAKFRKKPKIKSNERDI